MFYKKRTVHTYSYNNKDVRVLDESIDDFLVRYQIEYDGNFCIVDDSIDIDVSTFEANDENIRLRGFLFKNCNVLLTFK